jgi:hypothetical protein
MRCYTACEFECATNAEAALKALAGLDKGTLRQHCGVSETMSEETGKAGERADADGAGCGSGAARALGAGQREEATSC